MNLLTRFVKSCYAFDEYPKLIKTSFSSTVLYFVLFRLITFLCIAAATLSLFLPAYINMGGLTGMVEKYIPDFTISDGKLDLDAKINETYDDIMQMQIIIDTDKNFEESEIENSKYPFSILIDSSKIYMKDGENISVVNFSDFETLGITSKDAILESVIPVFKIMTIIISVIMLFSHIIFGVFLVLIFTFIAKLINLYLKTSINDAELFKLCFYAVTMPALLSTILSILNRLIFSFNLSMPQVVYIGVYIAYLYFALVSIKNIEKTAVEEQ